MTSYSTVGLGVEASIAEDIGGFTHDPLGFVLYAFDWGNGDLSKHTGPRAWQADRLETLGRALREGSMTQEAAIRLAVSSGNGVGKSTLVSFIILWAMSTMRDARAVVTANNETQLKTKTWAELSKWYHRMINKDWFELTATSLYSVEDGHDKNWRCDMIPWNKANPQAFAGLHNEGKRVLMVMDEASNIPDVIWEVAEGALTDSDTEIIWCVFGNPARNTGRFRECFRAQASLWNGLTVDASTVEGTNKVQHDEWIKTWGEDSDFVRVHVKGQFPRASTMQFIESDIVAEARRREPVYVASDPLVLAIDVARGGEDNMVFRFRRGKDARGIPPTRIPGSESRDSMAMVRIGVDLIEKHKPDAVFLDATGVGGPLADRFRELGYHVLDIQFASKSPDPHYANMRAYMWGKCREWLREGGAIDDSPELESGLISVEYSHNSQMDRLLLESKESMKKRGLDSPDDADALCMTFAYSVARRDGSRYSGGGGLVSDWDPLAEAVGY